MAPIATLMDERKFRPDPGSKTRRFRHTTQGLRMESSIRLILCGTSIYPIRRSEILWA